MVGANRFGPEGSTTNILASSHKAATLKSQLGLGGPKDPNAEDPKEPKRFYAEPHRKVEKDEVKVSTWYDEYFLLEEKIERTHEENEKKAGD